jgi:hypothetical protein
VRRRQGKTGREVRAITEAYQEFTLVLGNGETCRVRYCDRWSSPMYGSRTIHFEFLDCLSVSHIGYRSEFHTVRADATVDPQQAAKEIIESLTGIKFNEENVQQKLF